MVLSNTTIWMPTSQPAIQLAFLVAPDRQWRQGWIHGVDNNRFVVPTFGECGEEGELFFCHMTRHQGNAPMNY